MSIENPRSQKPSWRSGERKAGKPGARSWQGSQELKAVSRSESKRPRKLWRAALALMACCAAVVALVILISPPQAARLILIGADCADNLNVPANAYGAHALDDLVALSKREAGLLPFWKSKPLRLDGAGDEKGGDKAKAEPFRVEGADWKKKWEKQVETWRLAKGWNEPTILVFVALHGGADENGAYLLPDAKGMAEDRIRVKDLIDAMAKLPPGKNKVLIFDATQVSDNWPLGMLQNNFARALEDLRGDIQKVENLWVLSASGRNQRSWIDTGLKRSVFSRFLVEGMRGGADFAAAGGTGNGDNRINLKELYQYVTKEVDGWAKAARNSSQTPVLLPASDDEALARASRVALGFSESKKGDMAASGFSTSAGSDAIRASRDEWWEIRKKLDAEAPSPRAYAPHLWRRFTQTLMRLDHLTRADYPADGLVRELERIEAQILAAKSQGALKDSDQANLAMDAVIAGSGPGEGERALFDKIWKVQAPPEIAKEWENETKGRSDKLTRRRFHEYVFAQLIEPTPSLDLARGVASIRGVPITPQPVESQFLLMLAEHMPKEPAARLPDSLIRKALQVRRLAERTALGSDGRAYAYSEEVVPWIQGQVEAADKARRLGEDLLFVGAAQKGEAETQLREAEQRYETAATLARNVRRAIEVRNQAFADLPAYSRWWARRYPDSKSGATSSERIVELWRSVHLLADALQTPGDAASLDQLAIGVAAGLEDVAATFKREARPDVDERAPLPDDWVADSVADSGDVEDERARTCTHGRLALSEIGERWYDEGKSEGESVHSNALNLFSKESSATEADFWQRATKVGDTVGRVMHHRADMAREALSLVNAETKPEARLTHLIKADRLARHLEGFAELSGSPTTDLRKRRLHDLLLWLAQRTWLDHWYGESAKDVYFREVAAKFVLDAERLEPELKESVTRMRSKLEAATTLGLEGPPERAWTSEPALRLVYGLQTKGSAELPEGRATVWAQSLDDKLITAKAAAAGRTAYKVGGEAKAAGKGDADPIRFDLVSEYVAKALDEPWMPAARRSAEFKVRGFYRGQVFEQGTRVAIQPTPTSTLFQYPAPGTARVSVRSSGRVAELFGASNAAVTFILDFSDSMSEVYKEVGRALEEVARELPEGAVVSVWAYGPTVAVGQPPVNTDVFQLLAPVVWSRAQEGKLKASVDWLHPAGGTPLVRTMIRAMGDLNSAQGARFKTMVVLTDGGDSELVTKEMSPATKVQIVSDTIEKHFGDSDIQLNMIFFGRPDAEVVKEAQAQFEVIERLPTTGHRHQARASRSALAKAFRTSIERTLSYRIDTVTNLPVLPEGRVTGPGEPVSWSDAKLEPGTYNLVDPLGVAHQVSVAGGDRLSLELAEAAGALTLQRTLLEPGVFRAKVEETTNGWRVGVLRRHLDRNRSLKLQVSIEKKFEPTETKLEQIHPWGVWIEVEPQGAADPGKPVALRWYELDERPTSTWNLEVPNWPLDAQQNPCQAKVRVWWDKGRESIVPAQVDRKQPGFAIPLEHELKVTESEGVGSAVIESMDVETRVVADWPDERPRAVECLVVRVRHEAGKPLLVRPRGANIDKMIPNAQHCIYGDANRYTGIFWPVNRDQIQKVLEGLDLIPVAEIERHGEDNGFFAEISGLVPEPDDPGVEPIHPTRRVGNPVGGAVVGPGAR